MTGIPNVIAEQADARHWPVISAVRNGIGTSPVEYIAIVDCGQGTPTHPYTTVHLYQCPAGVKTGEWRYNLTWQQARQSLAERAGLIATPAVEVVVYAREPYTKDDTVVFIDGKPASPYRPAAAVITRVVYLDVHDEQAWWMVTALRRISHLSDAAQQHITNTINRIAAEHGIDLGQLAQKYAEEHATP